MDRRELLKAASGIAALAAVSGTAFAAEHDHMHHHAPANAGLAKTALDCVRTADICLKHCLDEFAKNDTTLAVCAIKVSELRNYCEALATGASMNSAYLKQIAALSAKVCEDCEAECRKHNKHQPCLDCADACKACHDECKKLAA